MNIAIVTNIRSPYRKLQIEKIAEKKKHQLNIYYTDQDVVGREWKVDFIKGVNEVYLKGCKIFPEYGSINVGLLKLVRQNDMIVIGGYEQPTYIVISWLCRLFKKPYIILYDGVSPKKIENNETKWKFVLKKSVISHAIAYFANGTCSKKYFMSKFNVKETSIFNQYLTVDIQKINEYFQYRSKYRTELRNKYHIKENAKVIIYSGRLIKRKNVDHIVKAIKYIKKCEDYHLLILGDGEEKSEILKIGRKLDISVTITGFIKEQSQLFKHYMIGDLLILPSSNEPWGLVINEAMAAGLPIIVSDECGASLDLVKDSENGFVISSNNIVQMSKKIEEIFLNNNLETFGQKSQEIIRNWTFENSAKSFCEMIESIKI